MKNQYRKGFFTLLGIVMALAVTCVLYYMLFNIYFKNYSVKTEDETGPLSPQNGPSIHNYQSTVDRAREKIKSMKKQQLDQFKQIEGFD